MQTLKNVVIFLPVLSLTIALQKPCQRRSYGYSSIVCVCNETYCDETQRPSKPLDGTYVAYTSSKSGLRFYQENAYFSRTILHAADITVININTTVRYQTILGWGGAFTDSTGININSLNAATANNLLRSYFSKVGLEYNLCRVPIRGTDFSTHGYSYHDDKEDMNLSSFKLAAEDFQYKIPLIKVAQNFSKDKLRLFASTWTAPKWMKHNEKYTGPDVLKKEMYQPWANYFLKFLEKYAEEGIKFWGLTTGNEPSTGLVPSKINSVGWLPWQMEQWISNNLGPTIRNSKFSSIKLITIDDQLFMFPLYIDWMLRNENVKRYIDGFGLHYYWNWLPKSILNNTHNKYPDKFILATEACEGVSLNLPHVKLGDWERGENYAFDIIGDINHWTAGWVDWNMALNEIGGPTYIDNFVDSPIIVNASAGEFYKQPMYYALGHFSKFVPEGSQRVKYQQSKNNLDISTFVRPDNGTVVVILNRNDYNIQIKIKSNNMIEEIYRIIGGRSIVTILHW
ncbi:hypothetical protein RN001_000171 [Aquatica leii]|uniref:Glucosylceramidase n=1 Tax=Aquatica leii TaxID=1421715 RepID=A0AAN7P9H3_9COLE|nr:hypothetical protein RN001_000171 [Aquatica leii]